VLEELAEGLRLRRSASLQRAMVPSYFPQFRNAAALAHLAHLGRGPRYVIVGGIAWYDPADILQWLENKKRTGPDNACTERITNRKMKAHIVKSKKRGRPTKVEQMLRRQR